MQGYKIADLASLKPRTVFWLIAGALVLTVFASHPTAIKAIYSYGVPNLGWWPRWSGSWFAADVHHAVAAPRMLVANNYTQMLLGASIVLTLHVLRQRFIWWPFHPLAYATILGPAWFPDRYCFSIFVGWLAKKAVKHIGGYKAYRRMRPAAIGLIVGNAVVLLVWTIIHYFHPVGVALIIE